MHQIISVSGLKWAAKFQDIGHIRHEIIDVIDQMGGQYDDTSILSLM